MEKFKPQTETWHTNKTGYHQKAFHLVMNKYQIDDGIHLHRDQSYTYDSRNPITSISYLRGPMGSTLMTKQLKPHWVDTAEKAVETHGVDTDEKAVETHRVDTDD